MKEREEDRFYYVIYPSETVVFDNTGKRIVVCPTEDEAIEYIREMEQGGKNEN